MKNYSIVRFIKSVFREAPGKASLLVAFVLVAGTLEGVGFTLFIPLVNIITSSGAAVPANDVFSSFFRAIGIVSLPVILFIVIAITAAKNIFLYFQKMFAAKISIDFEVKLKKGISRSVFASDWRFYLNEKVGTLVNAFTNAAKLSAMAFQIATQFIAEVINVSLYCAVGLLISWQTFLISMAAGAVYVFLSRSIVRRSRDIGQESVDATNDMQKTVLEDLTGIKFIKGNRMEEERKRGLFALVDRLAKLDLRREKYLAILDTFPELMMVVFMCAVFYVAHIHFGVPGGSLLVLLAVLYRFNRRIMALQGLRQRLLNYLPSYELCEGIINRAGSVAEKSGGLDFKGMREGIKFDKVRFSYTGHPVLDSVTFDIKKNSFAAFLGKSGGGKTTILDIIIGLLRPQGGAVTVDGLPLEDYDIFSWRSRLGYVSQEPFLVNGTIAENILMGKAGASMDDVRETARASHADEFIHSLPQGYDTVVGDRGVKLSGGQRQRIALARALIRKPDVIILDEATSALDNKSEMMIQDAIKSLKGKLTIIVVAHRLTSIEGADIIYMVNEGKIADSGTMESLKRDSGIFRDIYMVH